MCIRDRLDGYRFKEKEPGKGRGKFDPNKDISEQQHRIALEACLLYTSICAGKQTRRIVWQNISLAFGVKLLVLALGAGGLATLWEAVFADVGDVYKRQFPIRSP